MIIFIFILTVRNRSPDPRRRRRLSVIVRYMYRLCGRSPMRVLNGTRFLYGALKTISERQRFIWRFVENHENPLRRRRRIAATPRNGSQVQYERKRVVAETR